MKTIRLWAVTACALLALSAAVVLAAEVDPAVSPVNVVAAAQGGKAIAFSSQAADAGGKPLPQWQPANLIDGKVVATETDPPTPSGWKTAAAPSDTAPQWIVFAFAGEKTRVISRVAVDPTTPDSPLTGRWVRDIEMQVSNGTKDGPWKSVARFVVTNRPVKQSFDFPPLPARYVRLVITSNQGSDRCLALGEVEVYEAATGDDDVGLLGRRLEDLLNDLKSYREATEQRPDVSVTEDQTYTPNAHAERRFIVRITAQGKQMGRSFEVVKRDDASGRTVVKQVKLDPGKSTEVPVIATGTVTIEILQDSKSAFQQRIVFEGAEKKTL